MLAQGGLFSTSISDVQPTNSDQALEDLDKDDAMRGTEP